ncbi:hypothetical protein VTI74DRAFT_7741 [Chaetomium olivicolor]
MPTSSSVRTCFQPPLPSPPSFGRSGPHGVSTVTKMRILWTGGSSLHPQLIHIPALSHPPCPRTGRSNPPPPVLAAAPRSSKNRPPHQSPSGDNLLFAPANQHPLNSTLQTASHSQSTTAEWNPSTCNGRSWHCNPHSVQPSQSTAGCVHSLLRVEVREREGETSHFRSAPVRPWW